MAMESARLARANQTYTWSKVPVNDILRTVYATTCEGPDSETTKRWVNGSFSEEQMIENARKIIAETLLKDNKGQEPALIMPEA